MVSKQEKMVYDIIRANYTGPIIQSYRPDKLKNEKTGNNLEIDIYLKVERVGFEYQGAIHFNRIHRYKNDPDKSRLNDVKKLERLNDDRFSKYSIVEIFEADLTGDVLLNIINRVLITQSILFEKRAFYKCSQLERVLGYLSNELPKGINGGRYFIELLKLQDYKNRNINLSQSVNRLFNKMDTDSFLMNTRPLFSMKELCRVMSWRF